MPPRSEIRRGPQRLARSPPQYGNVMNDTTLWPDEGSDIDPEYVPSDTEGESESESDSEYDTGSSDEEESSEEDSD